MDQFLPDDVLGQIERARLRRRRARRTHLVVAGKRRHSILELNEKGFVIEADGLPHLRGYVDIMRGDERIARRLVVLAWAEDGLAGYEFKHEGAGGEIPADHVRPEHRGLLPGPGG